MNQNIAPAAGGAAGSHAERREQVQRLISPVLARIGEKVRNIGANGLGDHTGRLRTRAIEAPQ